MTDRSDAGRPLGGMRVLDLSDCVAGAFCTRLLADLGADTIVVEPAAGSSLRNDPFRWEYLAAGKRIVSADCDANRLAALAASADAVIADYPGQQLSGVRQALEWRGDVVEVWLSPFGLSGPYRDWQATEIAEWALGGFMYFGGTADRSPLLLPGDQAQMHGGVQGAFAALAGWQHARRTGKGQRVDVSAWESVLSAHWKLSISWSHTGQVWKRLERGAIDFLDCTNGQVFIQRTGRYNANFFELIERPDLAADPRWHTPAAAAANADELWAEVARWTARYPVDEVVARCQARRVAASPVNTLTAAVDSEQFDARRNSVTLTGPGGRRVRLPAAPYKFSAADLGPFTSAPGALAPGEEARWTKAAAPAQPAPTAQDSEDSAAFSGLRIVELGANWAGPLVTRMFGDLGAEVVKVESARHPATRSMYYPGNEPGRYPHNRSGYFNKMNRNKLGLSLDISTPAGRDVFLRLIERADVFVENQSPQVLRRLGITYEELQQVNPRLIMLCISGFGLTGPDAMHAAYGTNIEAASGVTALFGYEPGEKLRTGSLYADPLAGALGAVAVAAALRQRERTGTGQLIDLALQDAMLAFFGPDVTRVLSGAPAREPGGNRDAWHAPQGCYRCCGDDMWLVLTIRNEREWQALCQVLGRPDLAARPELASERGRRRAHDEIDAAIGGWSTAQDHVEAAQSLQAAGVPAAPVLKNWELLSDPHLAAREFYRPIFHPDTGVLPYPGFPWKFARTPGAVRRHAPRFAQDNDLILRELLNLGDERIRALDHAGVIERSPITDKEPS